jgi:hypothetical protein
MGRLIPTYGIRRVPAPLSVVWAAVLAGCCLSGCAGGGRSFPMGSNGRRSPQVEVSATHDHPERGRIRQISSLDDGESAEAADQSSSWSKLLGRFSKPKRMPLPRTDVESAVPTQNQPSDEEHLLGEF